MSVLTSPEAIPSRVGSVFRYLLVCEGHIDRYDRLLGVLSPENLRRTPSGFKPAAMISLVIDECRKMGLTQQEGETGNLQVRLSEKAWSMYGRNDFNMSRFKKLVMALLMDEKNAVNHDMCGLLAWFMAQDVSKFQGYHKWVSELYKAHFGVGLNDAQFGDLRDWSLFLGLAWRYRNYTPGQAGVRLVPDPTEYMKNFLQDYSADGHIESLALPELVAKLADDCPVLQGGFFYKKIAAYLPKIDQGSLSSTLSLALLRLEERGLVRMESRSDAPVMTIQDGSNSRRVTHVMISSEGAA